MGQDQGRPGGAGARTRVVQGMAGGAAGLVLLGTGPLAGCAPPLPPGLPDGLFAARRGVGRPLPDGVVLWTRLAPDPLNGGGMPAGDVAVALGGGHRRRVRRRRRAGTAVGRRRARPTRVHVDVGGLDPDAWYWYRFRVGGLRPARSAAPAPRRAAGADGRRCASPWPCQNWTDGLLHRLGARPGRGRSTSCSSSATTSTRAAPAPASCGTTTAAEVTTLDAYRNRYALYKGDPDLQAAHAACPWVVTWDDHEVDNNYAGADRRRPAAEPPTFLARRAAAYQAWWEHQPVRLPPPDRPRPAHHRSFEWGAWPRSTSLDTRQYRTDQACGDGDSSEACPELDRPRRAPCSAPSRRPGSAPGLRGVDRHVERARQPDRVDRRCRSPAARSTSDQWDGYPVARDRAVRRSCRGGVATRS